MKLLKRLHSVFCTTTSDSSLHQKNAAENNLLSRPDASNEVDHQKEEDGLQCLGEKIELLNLKIDSLVNQLNNAPQVIFNDEVSIIVSIRDFYLHFPKNQLNTALSYLDPQFDLGLRAFIYSSLRPGATFIDIGANSGAISGIAAKIIGSKGTLISVEPIPSLESSVKRNVFLNAPLIKHKHFSAAVGNSRAKLNIQVFENDSRVSTMHFYQSEDLNDNYDIIEVDVLEVSNVVPDDPENVFLKIDAEGSESEILFAIFRHWKDKPWINTIIVFEYANEHLARAGVNTSELNEMLVSTKLTARRINPYSGLLEESVTTDTPSIDGNYVIFQE